MTKLLILLVAAGAAAYMLNRRKPHDFASGGSDDDWSEGNAQTFPAKYPESVILPPTFSSKRAADELATSITDRWGYPADAEPAINDSFEQEGWYISVGLPRGQAEPMAGLLNAYARQWAQNRSLRRKSPGESVSRRNTLGAMTIKLTSVFGFSLATLGTAILANSLSEQRQNEAPTGELEPGLWRVGSDGEIKRVHEHPYGTSPQRGSRAAAVVGVIDFLLANDVRQHLLDMREALAGSTRPATDSGSKVRPIRPQSGPFAAPPPPAQPVADPVDTGDNKDGGGTKPS